MFHIVLIPSEKYIKYSAVLMNSIIKNTDKNKSFKDFCQAKGFKAPKNSLCDDYDNVNFNALSEYEKAEGYVFHILSDFVSDETRIKLNKLQNELSKHYPCEIQIHLMNSSEFKDLPLTHWIDNHATYYRLKAVSVVPENVSKVLALDTDMLVLADLRELFAIDVKEKMLIRTGDACHSMHDNRVIVSLNKNLKDYVYTYPKGTYFNAAFMLINTQKWRVLDMERKLFEFARNYAVQVCDQDVLNFVIENDTLKLNEKWNFFVGAWILDRFGAHNPFMGESANPYWPFSRQEMSEFEKDMKIVHFTHWCVKPWQSYYHSLDAAYKPVKYPYYDTWWHFALSTPIFNDELKTLQNKLKENALFYYSNTLGDRLIGRDREVNERMGNSQYVMILKDEYEARYKKLLNFIDPKLESAVVRVKNQLSYRLGRAMIANSKSSIGYLKIPFTLLKFYLIHRKEARIYKERVFYNPNLRLPKLETYADFNEALKVKNHLSYKLGSAFLKGLKTWYKFGLIKFCFEVKRLQREIEKNKVENG